MGYLQVRSSLGETNQGQLFEGFDRALGRSVWIHVLGPETRAAAAGVRDSGRPTRLRWLTGRRTSTEAWDAYEAAEGVAFWALTKTPQSWDVVRRWLVDLARELHAGRVDGSIGTLSVELLWISPDGAARLLDFVPPGGRATASASSVSFDASSGQQFLAALARRSLSGLPGDSGPASETATPPPLRATRLIEKLAQSEFESPEAMMQAIDAATAPPLRIGRLQRATAIAVSAVIGLITLAITLGAAPGGRLGDLDATPAEQRLDRSLRELRVLEAAGGDPLTSVNIKEVETYVAGTFRSMILDDALWQNPRVRRTLGPNRRFAVGALDRHSVVSPEELQRATAAVAQLLAEAPRVSLSRGRGVWAREQFDERPATTLLVVLGVVILAGLAPTIILRAGLAMRFLGIAIVLPDGREASRARATLRALVNWLPVLAIWCLMTGLILAGGHVGPIATPEQRRLWLWAAEAVYTIIVAWAIARPARGLADQLAGTWLVRDDSASGSSNFPPDERAWHRAPRA